MKKFTTILITCSLALAAGALAQKPEEQQTPAKKKQSEKARPGKEAKAEPKGQSARKEQAQTKAPGQENAAPAASMPQQRAGTKAKGKQPANAETNATANPNETGTPSADATATGEGKKQAKQGKKQRNAPDQPATAKTSASPAPASASAPSPAPAAPQPNQPSPQPNKRNAQAKKPDPQAVQAIKAQHAEFRAQPRPEQVPAVTFNQAYRIQGADQWQGEQYGVFRAYRPEIHDQSWYRSRYNRVELIGGGYYYWNQGYWYPAWGYDRSAQYYAYDGPIYVGSRAEPPDRVIADVQAILQQQGYYTGEVDGLLGPLTRQALTAYQSDNGLYTTAAIDEPTLSSLGMG